MTTLVSLARRDFLRVTALAGGGLVLAVFVPGLAPAQEAPPADGDDDEFAPNAFVRIASSGTITIIVNHSEMGQGTYTSIAMTVAEELDADWSKIQVEAAPVDPVYNHPGFGMQATGGSTSTWVEWDRLRKAGAAARHMLVAAAAAQWGVEASSCTTDKARVLHAGSGRELSYAALAEAASKLEAPSEVTLKERSAWKLLGTPQKRIDTPDKTNGKAVFGLDVNLPKMLVAIVVRPPVFGGALKKFDATRAKKVEGVEHVLEVPGRGVAVVAKGFWAAKLGGEALDVTWDEGPLASYDSQAEGAEYTRLAGTPGRVARNDGDAEAALKTAAKVVGGTFDLPYLPHAPMEPLNAVADVRKDGCDVWTGTQFQTLDHATAVRESGLAPEQVKLHTTLLGGGFGRRGALDSHFVREAVFLSKALGVPIKVVWTREDDIRGGCYRPRALHRVQAGIDAQGKPVAWHQRIVCQSFMIGTSFEPFVVKDGIDHTATEGASDTRYAIPNLRVEWHRAAQGPTTHFWRSVGHSHTAFAVESVIDELAHAAKKDPVEFRLAHHGDARSKGALAAAWALAKKTPLEPGRARGVAVHESFGSYVAHVAEVSVSKDGKLRVHRYFTAIDVGPVVNPDTVKAQMEGAVVFGLSAALYGEVTLKGGRVEQRNFHDYPLLRMHECPTVEVVIIDSTEKMGGAGEPGVPPVAPALTNAIFAATGKRVRRLPLRHEDLRRA